MLHERNWVVHDSNWMVHDKTGWYMRPRQKLPIEIKFEFYIFNVCAKKLNVSKIERTKKKDANCIKN